MSLASILGELPSTAWALAGKGALISLIALSVASALRRRASAASRHLVLALAAAALLMLPLMTAVLPAWNLPVLPRAEAPGTEQTPPAARASLPGPGAAPGQPGVPPRSGAAAPSAAAPSAAAPSAAASSRTTASPGFLPLLLLTVSLLLLIRLALLVHRLSRLRTGSRPAPAEWQALLDRQRRRLGIARPVRLAVSAAVAVPVTFGWRRPLVLIPEAALGWEEQPLREALVHELSHVQRGDWPVQIMARAACALHWFNPLTWMLCRRLLLEAELACDDQVVQAGTGAEGYAERLVSLARQVRGAARRPAAAVAFARPSGLASRVASLLDAGRRRGGPGRLAVAGATAAALVLLLLVAPAHLVRAASPSGEEVHAPKQRPGATSTFPVSSLPPLLRASWEGDLAVVRRLLAAGADPDVYVPGDETALQQAVEGGHAEVARILREAGAAPLTGEALEEAVEGGVDGALNEDAIRDGVRDGVHEGVDPNETGAKD